jgi:hypothetical protein
MICDLAAAEQQVHIVPFSGYFVLILYYCRLGVIAVTQVDVKLLIFSGSL